MVVLPLLPSLVKPFSKTMEENIIPLDLLEVHEETRVIFYGMY
jgi:hypothetical protein